MEGFKFSTIEEAVADLRAGKMIIAVDDPDRENEGDLICAAEHATLENVNFMASYAKGLICMPMSKALTTKLGLEQMVANNTDNHCTAFTVSIDHVDTTTGISALERSMTAMKSVKDDAKPSDFRRPGHMFPLEAKAGGVLERMGHTEATVDLMRIARLKECGLCCEIMREDGTMMRTPELKEFAVRHGLKICQEFARINRRCIQSAIFYTMNWTLQRNTWFDTIHNYIDHDTNIVRKGAISARHGEKVLIPMNMRDGCIIAVGKGNDDWNCSAPHGAGRIMSRSKAKENISLEEFKESMDGIYTTSVQKSTIDESPMAYKPPQEIIDNIKDTVEIVDIIKPIYNFKASE